jgi:NitT/TauT family transport system substrate-binding protein
MVHGFSRRALLAGAAAFAATRNTARAADTTIHYAAAVTDDLRPFLYAQNAGLFKQVGLDVQLVTNATGANVAQAVAGGAVDIGKSSVTSLIAAYAHGLPFYFVAPGTYHRPQELTSAICVAANAPYKSVLELQGKTVSSTGVGSIASLGLRALIDNSGGDATTVKFVELPYPAVIPALQTGRIDAGLLGEPNMSVGIKAGEIRQLVDEMAGYSRPVLEVASFCTRDYAAKNKDAVAKFGKAMAAANGYANTHVPETEMLLLPLTKLDPQQMREMHHGFNATSFDAAALQPIIDTMAKYKQIPASFDAKELLKPV